MKKVKNKKIMGKAGYYNDLSPKFKFPIGPCFKRLALQKHGFTGNTNAS